ncbi:MAG: hypothetical protein AAF408_03505 [Pseudomonadota bacterium]
MPGFLLTPSLAEAAGGDSNPPKPTNTTKKCLFGRVWDAEARRCKKPAKTNFTDEEMYDAVREMAYAGRYEHAQDVLREMSDQASDKVLTYWGFTYRKMGEAALANSFYERAIAVNPDNILARSYMGQGFVAEGKTDLAIAQWQEIVDRGGKGSWAETSLRDAIRTGLTYSY